MSTSVWEPVPAKSISYEEEWGKPMPSRNHGRVQTNLIVEFAQNKQWSVYSELTLLIEGRKFTPDLSVYRQEPADFRHDEAARTDLPLLTVEILSASQTVESLVEKAELYLRHGVKSCWIVSPPLRTVSILLPNGREEVFHGGIATDPATGLTADLAKVFS